MKTHGGLSHPLFDNIALGWLCVAAGSTDVMSFFKLGNLFTSAMTGNTALFAIAVARGEITSALRSLSALLAFAVGVAVGSAIRNHDRSAEVELQKLLLIELLFLGACALLWSASPDPIHGPTLYPVIVLSAFSMGIQAIGARTINSSGISTIVFTSALIRIIASTTDRLIAKSKRAQSRETGSGAHLSTFAAYGMGAAFSGLMISRHFRALIWLPLISVLIAYLLSHIALRRRGSPTGVERLKG